MTKALTELAIQKAKPGVSEEGAPALREIPDGLMRGLYLVVYPSGKKGWAVRYRHKATQKPRKLTLEPYPVLGLGDARERARDALLAVSRGNDPAAEKQLAKKAAREGGSDRDTFKNVVAEFLKRHVAGLRSAPEIERQFEREVLPTWGERRIQEITKRDVIDLLDRIVDSGRGTTANRVLAAIRKLFSWTLERDILSVSPCTGVKPPAEETSRDRVLSDDEIRWLWQACDVAGWPFGKATKLLLVTAQRKEEVGGLTYRELALDGDPSWTIPAARAKNRREQYVPLPGLAVDIIKGLPRIAGKLGYVFSTNGETPVSGYSRAKSILDREMLRIAREETGDAEFQIRRWTYHDLRRTAATGMQKLGFPIEVVEAVLNHKSGVVRGVAAIYGRHSFKDEKGRALSAWGSFLENLVSEAPASNVVALRA